MVVDKLNTCNRSLQGEDTDVLQLNKVSKF